MDSFLYRVAEVFYKEHAENFSDFTFVFPNRRAGLFFRKYLTSLIKKPVFSPEIITVNECFFSASGLQPADRISMLFRLYEIYIHLSHSTESFDVFAFWGEILLSDFNEVDRYMVDARQLFTNVTELKAIDDSFDHLTENQLNAIRTFWKDFAGNIEMKKNRREFVEIWKILFELYQQFSNALLEENSGTDGMIFRQVAERCRNNEDIDEWKGKRFVFVGFNALNPCERTLMKYLQKREMADFYWDYEWEILKSPENPASTCSFENTQMFLSKYEIQPRYVPFSEKSFRLISVPSSTGQGNEVSKILNEIENKTGSGDNWIKTAIVLPDENLLLPVINTLSEQIENVNITMGYPLGNTPLSGLIESIFELQKRKQTKDGVVLFYFRTVLNVLNHQYIKVLCNDEAEQIIQKIHQNNKIYVSADEIGLNELLQTVFQNIDNSLHFPDYLLSVLVILHRKWLKAESEKSAKLPVSEFIYLYYKTLNRFADVLKTLEIKTDLLPDTIMRFIRQLISGVSIPFTGEPLEGLQVMGMLETRGLDFTNVIITSFNEGVLPGKNVSQSFIPYNLRKCFELPVYEQQDAIMSYNFYRLLQRAKNIYMIYDSRTEGVNSGEVSRFFYQLKYHYKLNIELKNTVYDISFGQQGDIKIEKSEEILKKLNLFLEKGENASALSASSVNNYVDCPLKFYLSSVEKIKEPDEISELPGNDVFGSVFHAAMEYVYKPFTGKFITEDTIESILKKENELRWNIYKALTVKYFKKNEKDTSVPKGNLLLISEVIFKYVISVLENDQKYAPFRYIDSEKEFRLQLKVDAGEVNIKGFIDRIDEKEGKIRILDYKTGTENLKFKSLEDVFSHDKKDRNAYVLQTMLYGLYYSGLDSDKTIEPGLYFIRKSFKEAFDTCLLHNPAPKVINRVDDFSVWSEPFTEYLTECINEIFDPEIPFFQTSELSICKNCSFTEICKR